MTTDEVLRDLQRHWSWIGAKTQPGASAEALTAFEARYRVSLPPDVRAYFELVNGMPTNESDDQLLEFFPIQAVLPVPEAVGDFGGIPDYRMIARYLPDADHWFVMVDWSITAHVYATRMTQTPGDSGE